MNKHRSNWSVMGSCDYNPLAKYEYAYRDMRTMFNKQKINKLFKDNDKKAYLEKCRYWLDIGYSDYVYSKL